MTKIPVTYQEISEYLSRVSSAEILLLRKRTIERIEGITGIPLVCYVSKAGATHSSIEEEDITGFSDLIYPIEGDSIGVFLISNGGSPLAAERIVKLLRSKFNKIVFYARQCLQRRDNDVLCGRLDSNT